MTISGGCLCGAVRYEIDAEPITTRVCWCKLCQKIGAGSSTVNVAFPSDKIKVTGELRDYQCIADSGNKMHRQFCPNAGTTVFTGSEARPHILAVRAGTLAMRRWLSPLSPSGQVRRRAGQCSIPISRKTKANLQPRCWREQNKRGHYVDRAKISYSLCRSSQLCVSRRGRANKGQTAAPGEQRRFLYFWLHQ